MLPQTPAEMSAVTRLRCEFIENPLALDLDRPRLSWALHSTQRNARQTAYRVLVASSPQLADQHTGDLWDTGKVTGNESINIEYEGEPLEPGTTAFWKVQVWDEADQSSPWSEAAHFSIGLLQETDWEALWIGMASAEPADCPWFRKSFTLHEIPESALAYIGSIGYHELFINGRRVGDQVLSPSVSDLSQRALYCTYDVRSYLQPGENVIGLWAAPGWGQFSDANPGPVDFGVEKLSVVIAQLQFGAFNGPFTRVVSDESWKCSRSTTMHLGKWQNRDFGGDHLDANLDIPGWNDAGFIDSAWEDVTSYNPNVKLSADFIEPNRILETIPALEVTEAGPGKYRFTMSKLYTGWIEATLKGKPGQAIVITASSLPDQEVECNQRDEYVIGPSGTGTFRHRFSYHLIEFVTIEGLDYRPELADVSGYRIGNDRKRVGHFDSSSPLLKQIYDITLHTYENLTLGGMTVDCPHRERLGYGGDGHTSLELALDTYESAAFFSRWAQDWCDIQQADGNIYHTAPTKGGGGGPGWSGFVIPLAWETYQTYGNRRILEKVYPHARKWLSFLDVNTGEDGLLAQLPGGYWMFLGDWLAPGRSEGSDTPEALLFNNCYYLYTARLTAKIARLLGHEREEKELLVRAAELQIAINRRFLNPETKAYLDTRQTHCVMPLISGAVAPEDEAAVLRNLEHEILVEQNGHLDTGLHGTYYLTKLLTDLERSDLIFSWASQTTAPGYGDLIARGYTSWPECWEGAPSRLHGCFNSIGGWFLRGLGGIRPDEPGFAHFIIRPALVGDLTWVKTHFDSIRGRIVSNWSRVENRLLLEIEVPANTSATVYIPASDPATIHESGVPANLAPGVQFLHYENGTAIFEVASGGYQFKVEPE